MDHNILFSLILIFRFPFGGRCLFFRSTCCHWNLIYFHRLSSIILKRVSHIRSLHSKSHRIIMTLDLIHLFFIFLFLFMTSCVICNDVSSKLFFFFFIVSQNFLLFLKFKIKKFNFRFV